MKCPFVFRDPPPPLPPLVPVPLLPPVDWIERLRIPVLLELQLLSIESDGAPEGFDALFSRPPLAVAAFPLRLDGLEVIDFRRSRVYAEQALEVSLRATLAFQVDHTAAAATLLADPTLAASFGITPASLVDCTPESRVGLGARFAIRALHVEGWWWCDRGDFTFGEWEPMDPTPTPATLSSLPAPPA